MIFFPKENVTIVYIIKKKNSWSLKIREKYGFCSCGSFCKWTCELVQKQNTVISNIFHNSIVIYELSNFLYILWEMIFLIFFVCLLNAKSDVNNDWVWLINFIKPEVTSSKLILFLCFHCLFKTQTFLVISWIRFELQIIMSSDVFIFTVT